MPHTDTTDALDARPRPETVLDSLAAHIAILDETGVIVSVNRPWRAFAAANGLAGINLSEGANYLHVCDDFASDGAETAGVFAEGIRDVFAGRRAEFLLEYPCHAPGRRQWFVGRVTRLVGDGPSRVPKRPDLVQPRRPS
jgi:hypothetical protein